MKKMTLIIAGTSVAIRTDESIAFLLTPLSRFFRGFIKARGPATHELTISYDNQVRRRKFKTYPVPLTIKKRGDGTILRHVETLYPLSEGALLIGFLNGILAYNLRSQKGHIYLFRSTGKKSILGGLHKLLFLFMAFVLAEQGKLMIHGAGLGIESEGCLFVGNSGAGKSTVAGYVQREALLSDDAPVITKGGGVFTIHASPFGQVDLFDDKAANHHRKQAPLHKILFLNQAAYTELKPRDKRSVLAEVLRDHIHGFDLMGRDLKIQTFLFCCDLCASVPGFDLYFQKDDRFLSLVGYQNHVSPGRSD